MFTNEEKGELAYLRRRVRELERENAKLQLRLEELEQKYRGVKADISYMRGEDQYDI